MLAAILLAHGYLWWRLVRSTTRQARGRRRLRGLLATLALLVTFALVPFPPKVLLPVQWAGFTWLGFAFYVLLGLLALEPVRWAARLRVRRSEGRTEPTPADGETADRPLDGPAAEAHTGRPEQSRRLLLARGLAIGAGTVALGAIGVGVRSANGAPVVRRLPVTLAALDPALDGFRIVTFSEATCRRPTAVAGSSGSSSWSTRSDPTSSPSSVTWSTASSNTCGRRSHR